MTLEDLQKLREYVDELYHSVGFQQEAYEDILAAIVEKQIELENEAKAS